MSEKSKLKFEPMEKGLSRVFDGDKLVAIILEDLEDGKIELDTLRGDHLFWAEDLDAIAAHMRSL